MAIDFLEHNHIVPAFVPVADAFAGGITTEYVNLENYTQACLVVSTGDAEDTGISNLVTIEASDDAAGSNTTAMAFRWRACPYSTTVDTWTALTESAATGYNFAVNQTADNGLWYATVTADEVSSAQADAKFICAVIAETANKTITAGGIWILSGAKHAASVPETAIA